jgi:hypothetical protein
MTMLKHLSFVFFAVALATPVLAYDAATCQNSLKVSQISNVGGQIHFYLDYSHSGELHIIIGRRKSTNSRAI